MSKAKERAAARRAAAADDTARYEEDQRRRRLPPLDERALPLPHIGRLQISRPMNAEPDVLTISLVDEASRTIILRGEVLLDEFAKGMLASSRDILVRFDARTTYLGARAENDTVTVEMPRRLAYRFERERLQEGEAERDALFEPYETNGWVVDRTQADNPHTFKRHTGDTVIVELSRHRFVDDAGNPIARQERKPQ